MPQLTYRGQIALSFTQLAGIPGSGNYEADVSPVGALSAYNLLSTKPGLTQPGPGNQVAATDFYHFADGQWNHYTIANSSSGPATLTTGWSGLIVNGHLVTMGIDPSGNVLVNDTPLASSFTGAAIALSNLAIGKQVETGGGGSNPSNPMLVTLAPGDVAYGLNFSSPFGFGGSSALDLYDPAAVTQPPPLAFGGGHDAGELNATDVTNGINYTVLSVTSGFSTTLVLRVWTYNPATKAADYSVNDEAITIGAPGTGITAFQKATPFGFLFYDATLGLCLSDLACQNYWQLALNGLPSGAQQMTMDASGHLYVFVQNQGVWWTSVPYYSIPGGSSGGAGAIPAGGAPVASDPGVDPHIVLQLSDDGGRTWGIERPCSTGKLGKYRTLVRWRRLGRSNNRAFRTIDTSPVARALIECDLDSSQ